MLSAALPPPFSFDSFLGPFPPFEPCFPAPEFNEQAALTPQAPQEPLSATNSGSDEPNRDSTILSEQEQTNSKTLPSGWDENGRLPSAIDERKRRRMQSNRESAQRSRMRKQRHVENLRNLGTRLKVGNRELVNRLRLVLHQIQIVASDNESLRSEAVLLRQRLCDIRQILLVRHLQQHLNPPAVSAWPCINNVVAPPLTPDNHHQYLTKY